ncbi:MAG: trehalose-6-phosphate synthase [Paracoccaceae bacterium]
MSWAFAEAAAEEAAEGTVVWIRDYDLRLLPEYLRRLRPDRRIAFFRHTPFPSADMFNVLPWRSEIGRSLLFLRRRRRPPPPPRRELRRQRAAWRCRSGWRPRPSPGTAGSSASAPSPSASTPPDSPRSRAPRRPPPGAPRSAKRSGPTAGRSSRSAPTAT